MHMIIFLNQRIKPQKHFFFEGEGTLLEGPGLSSGEAVVKKSKHKPVNQAAESPPLSQGIFRNVPAHLRWARGQIKGGFYLY